VAAVAVVAVVAVVVVVAAAVVVVAAAVGAVETHRQYPMISLVHARLAAAAAEEEVMSTR
jgi:hypothetical protein